MSLKQLESSIELYNELANFKALCFINKMVTKDQYRITNHSEIRLIKKTIKEMHEKIFNTPKEQLVNFIANYMSKLWLTKIFFDGNTRTTVLFFNYFSKQYGLPFYYDYDNSTTLISGALGLTFFGEKEDFKKLKNIISNSIVKEKITTKSKG